MRSGNFSLVQLVLLLKPRDFGADQSLRNRRNDLPSQGADRLVGVGGDLLADSGADAFDLFLRSGVGDAAGFREDLPLNLAEELVDRGGGAREALELLADEALDEGWHDLPGKRRRRLFHAAAAFPEDLLLELRQELVDRGGGVREALELLADEALDEGRHDLPGERRHRLFHAAAAFPEDLLLELRQELVDRGGGVREAFELLADEALDEGRYDLPGERRHRRLHAAAPFPEDLPPQRRQELVDRGGGVREALELLADEALDEGRHDLPGERRHRLFHAAAAFPEDLLLELRQELVDRGGGVREALELLADGALDEGRHDLPGERRHRLFHAAAAFPEDLLLELRQELVDRGGGVRGACELLADEALDEGRYDLPGERRHRLFHAAAAFPEDLLLELRQELVDRGGGLREALALLADEALDEGRHDLPGERRHRLFHAAAAFPEDLLLELRQELVDRGGGVREALELLADEALDEGRDDLPGERRHRLFHAAAAFPEDLLLELRQELVDRGGGVREAFELLADEALDEGRHDFPGERRHRLFHAAAAFPEDLLLELRQGLVERGGGVR